MLNNKEIEELRARLESAQNPLFLYGNDADGLCSFVLLRRWLEKGKGVAVRTKPDIDSNYLKKVEEFKSDVVVVLDCPILGEKFLERADEMKVEVIWIDHHYLIEIERIKLNERIKLFNPLYSDEKSDEPVTYISYIVSGRKEDMWIALMGCLSDHFLPDFAEEFARENRDLWSRQKSEDPFAFYYNAEIGRLARAIGFGLKDSITHVVYMQNFLIYCKNVRDLILELEGKSSFAVKYKELMKKYTHLMERALENRSGKIIYFEYSGEVSMSSELANELSYIFKGKFVIVAYLGGDRCNVSIRGKNVLGVIEKILKEFEGASGGGHRDAVGVKLRKKDLERFRVIFESLT